MPACGQDWDDNELGMMAAAVTKMSRIIQHVGSGEKGTHVLQKLQARAARSLLHPFSWLACHN
jgi:hypothetical protein